MDYLLLLYFFVYASIGWMMEVGYNAVHSGRFINAGMLSGPWCPIYGFGACAVILFLSDIARTNKLWLFFGSMLIASAIELVTGFVLEKLLHRKWWDYSYRRLNLGGYICLEYSLLWGMCCFVLYEAVHPLLRRLIRLLPVKLAWAITAVLLLLLLVDVVNMVATLFGLNKKWKHTAKFSRDMRKVSDQIGERVYVRTRDLEEKRQELHESEAVKRIEKRREKLLDRWLAFSQKRMLNAFPYLTSENEDEKKNKEGE
ncbi:putative ABC transporter permease [Murdochiella vaginalis]|uniref:putative ABC transporter permease n=1 Tax=Murdochiella vaginalis TaxID=1852373 RepID=UPI0008FE727E|nr:putative ABC transporter permease [Murdochiella vaginalis]